MSRVLRALALATLAACTPAATPAREAADTKPAVASASAAEPSAPSAPPAADKPAAARSFGAPAGSVDGPLLTVADVLREPEAHLGKKLRCEGVVARVCQRAGCWLELSPDGKGEGLRVPMAGHAFFIPQDAVGQHAVIEGVLSAAPLNDAHRAHLEGEGAKAIGPLSLAATTVTLN